MIYKGYNNNIPISQNNIIPVNNVVPNNAVNLSVFPGIVFYYIEPSGNVNARLNSFLLPNSSMLQPKKRSRTKNKLGLLDQNILPKPTVVWFISLLVKCILAIKWRRIIIRVIIGFRLGLKVILKSLKNCEIKVRI